MHPEQLLGNLNLPEYIPLFKENEIESSMLPLLNHDLLKDIGVASVGHRITILYHAGKTTNEIQQLQQQIDKLRGDLDPIFKMAKDLTVFLKKNKKKQVAIKVYQDSSTMDASIELFKSFRVSNDDPCSKILPDALRKYKIEDDWQNYALFIVYGKNEKCLGYDEKPLIVYNLLKDKGEDPMFVLKHIKQVYSPEGNPSRSNKSDVVNSTAAIVIYEYDAKRDDELSISIGDKVYIQKKTDGWNVVLKDKKQGWVPSGCLLEDPDNDLYNPPVPTGIATFDYDKVGPNEISMKSGDLVNIKKKYKQWLYVELNKTIGFVPVCYVNLDTRQRSTSRLSTIRRPSTSTTSPSASSANLKYGDLLDFIDPYIDVEDRAKDILNDIWDDLKEYKDKLNILPAPLDNNKKIFNDVRKKSESKANDVLHSIDKLQDNASSITLKEIDELSDLAHKLQLLINLPAPLKSDANANITRLTDYQHCIEVLCDGLLDILRHLNILEDDKTKILESRPVSRYGSNRRLRSPVTTKTRKKL